MQLAKEAILADMLKNAPFDGWTDKTFMQSVSASGIPKALAYEAFPDGAIDVIAYHNAKADADLEKALKSNPDFLSQKIRLRIFTAVMTRLDAHVQDREAIARAASLLRMPWYAPSALKMLYATVDTMWRCAGDTSTDYNFYTKRIILAKVYSLTLQVWLHDDSENFEKTRQFLHNRIENVMQFEKLKAGCKDKLNGLSSLFSKPA